MLLRGGKRKKARGHLGGTVAFLQDLGGPVRKNPPMHAEGTFEVKMTAEPPVSEADGITIGRARFDKVFSGPLTASSVVHGVMVRTTDPMVRAYVAVERVDGQLDGRRGSFLLIHDAAGTRLELTIMAGSGRGELTGIEGTMSIRIEGGQHFYSVDYDLPR